ncbi:MAG: glutaredoxin domain-containing protein [Candidatus Altimarinota bacterium]
MITIFTKDYCPYCMLAKELLGALGYEYTEVDLSDDHEKLMELVQIGGMRTLPQIFVGEITKENLIGGYSDIKKLNDEGTIEDIFGPIH